MIVVQCTVLLALSLETSSRINTVEVIFAWQPLTLLWRTSFIMADEARVALLMRVAYVPFLIALLDPTCSILAEMAEALGVELTAAAG